MTMAMLDYVREVREQKERKGYLKGLEQILNDVNQTMPDYRALLSEMKVKAQEKLVFEFTPAATNLVGYIQDLEKLEEVAAKAMSVVRSESFRSGDEIVVTKEHHKIMVGTRARYIDRCYDFALQGHIHLPGASDYIHMPFLNIAKLSQPLPPANIRTILSNIREETEQKHGLPRYVQWREEVIKEGIKKMREWEYKKKDISLFFAERLKDKSYVGEWVKVG